MMQKISHCLKQFQNATEKMAERVKITVPNTYLHDISLLWLSTGTSIKSGGVKLVLWQQVLPSTIYYIYDMKYMFV
jgi:hypothetical protein